MRILFLLESNIIANSYFDYLKMPCHVVRHKLNLLKEDLEKKEKEIMDMTRRLSIRGK